MSVLTYGNVRMQIQKTEHFHFAPRYTEDNADYLYTELDLGVTAVVNQQALATLGVDQIAGANQQLFDDSPAQANGDRLGISLRNLRAMLLTPRQNLTFAIDGDVVLQVSGPDACNGPLVQPDTCVRVIMGTATAFIYFHVKCFVPEFVPTGGNARRIVLANRYRVTSILDENWYTTRHVSGQMIVDAGQLLAANNALGVDAALFPITPDSFRQAAFLQIPLGFKRQNVQVTVSSDSTTLDYSYTDEETPLALGVMSLATKVEGYTSVGGSSGIENLGLIAKSAIGAAAAAVDAATNNSWWPWHPIDNIRRMFGWGGKLDTPEKLEGAIASAISIPKLTANGIIRITGQRNAQRADLVALGVNLLWNIFNTPAKPFYVQNANGNVPRMASLHVTQDIAERFVEVRGTFITNAYTDWLAWATNPVNIVPNLVNFQADLASGDPQGGGGGAGPAGVANPLSGSLAAPNPPPPFGGGTRGNYLGGLVAALLSAPGQLPSLPPDHVAVIDLGAFI